MSSVIMNRNVYKNFVGLSHDQVVLPAYLTEYSFILKLYISLFYKKQITIISNIL